VTARIGAALWIASTVVYFVTEAVAAAAVPGYEYAHHYISSLGQPDISPRSAVMNFAFLMQAVALPLGGWLLCRGRKATLFLAFAVCNGVGNVVVALVHSGTTSPWHGIGAAMAIGGGNATVLAGAWALRPAAGFRAYRAVSLVLGVVGLACLAVVVSAVSPVGAWERGSVYTIYAWQTMTAVAVLVGSAASVRKLGSVRGVSAADTHARGK
jgi:hypothetical membrane protein